MIVVFPVFPYADDIKTGRRVVLMAISKEAIGGTALVVDLETGAMSWNDLSTIRLDVAKLVKIKERQE